jgi:hypothetical protein
VILFSLGIAGPERTGGSSSSAASANAAASINDDSALEHGDYRAKLSQIRQLYHSELEKYVRFFRGCLELIDVIFLRSLKLGTSM